MQTAKTSRENGFEPVPPKTRKKKLRDQLIDARKLG